MRIGLRLGLLLGITFAVVKTVQLRRASSASAPPGPWEPIPAPPPVDEVGEPILEPSSPAPAPAAARASSGPEPLATDVPPTGPLTPGDLDIGAQAAESSNGSSGGPPPAPAAGAKKAGTRKAPAKKAAKAAKKAAKATAQAGPAWVEPVGGTCPPSHPVKAKLSSLIYHLPGMVAYDRTRANRCYIDAAAAEADGFARAKR